MFYFWILFLIFIDLLTKYIAKIYLIFQKNIFGDFLYLKYIENTWIAFSIPLSWIALKILTIIIIWVIFYHYYKEEKVKKSKIIDLSFCLILWWALWNAYERIFNSRVIDFIWIKFFSIFNLADVFICLWVFIYILYITIKKKDE